MDYKYTRNQVITWIRLNGQRLDYSSCECYWINNFTMFNEVLLGCTPITSDKNIVNIGYALERDYFLFHLIRMDMFEEMFLLESGYLIGKSTINCLMKQQEHANILAKRYSQLCIKCKVPGNITLENHLIWLIKEYEKIFNS